MPDGVKEKTLSATAASVTTASITPELFADLHTRTLSRALLVTVLTFLLLVGFGLRATQLGVESLSEDELNKLYAVEDYRARGLTSSNGEHPWLMKGLMTASIVVAERWNATSFAQARAGWRISTEGALRFPAALFGALTAVLLFFVVAELFGPSVGLIAAALWALDPAAIGFNRIGKEDTFLLFFFLLANVFWLRGQRVAESGAGRPQLYYWATAAAFGAMLASKYLPYFLIISVGYYYIFQDIPATRWRLGPKRWLLFFAVMGAAFLLLNPTILLLSTWREMSIFAGEQRIGHDAYEFMGQLYRNKMSLWLAGSPWYFYYAFMAFKLPLLLVISFLVGLPLLFRRRLGDGRYFVIFWLFFWFFPFSLLGGKFLRYFTLGLPVVIITAALGIHFAGQHLGRWAARAGAQESLKPLVHAAAALMVLSFSAYASFSAAPHYRLYTNALGGGWERAGAYFPHDEFYDASAGEAANYVAAHARPQARVASETPELTAHYARLAGRNDLLFISLSDAAAVAEMGAGDWVIYARGRRYFSNDALVRALHENSEPAARLSLGIVPSVAIFKLDEASAAALRAQL